MPTLETTDGKPVDVTPVDAESVNAAFQQAMNDDGPDEQALPKRAPRAAAPEGEAPKRRGRPPKEEKSRTVAKAAVTLTPEKRAEGVKGLVQIGAGLCLLTAKASKKDAYKADAVTIASAADDIAGACMQVAEADPGFAAALDKVCSVGPYGAMITVMLGVGSQIVRNHRPSLVIPNTVHPDELLAAAARAEAQPVAA